MQYELLLREYRLSSTHRQSGLQPSLHQHYPHRAGLICCTPLPNIVMFHLSYLILLTVLSGQALTGCVPSKQKACPPASPPSRPRPATSIWLDSCPKGIPKKWACLDPKLVFPTVDCIVQDLKACGTLEKNPLMLYSFQATTVEVRTNVHPGRGLMRLYQPAVEIAGSG